MQGAVLGGRRFRRLCFSQRDGKETEEAEEELEAKIFGSGIRGR